MDKELLIVMDKVANAIEGNNAMLGKVSDVLSIVVDNQTRLMREVDSLSGFAREAYERINDMTVQIDTLSAVVIEGKIVEPEKFRAMMSELHAEQQRRIMASRIGQAQANEAQEGAEKQEGGVTDGEAEREVPSS